MRRFFLAFITLSVLLAACSKPEVKLQQIHFGSGGGFTGAISGYTLMPDGNLYRQNNPKDSMRFIRSLSSDEQGRVQSALTQVQLDTVELNRPDNLYFFLTIPQHQSEHTIVWGDPQHPVPAEVQELYDLLAGFVGN